MLEMTPLAAGIVLSSFVMAATGTWLMRRYALAHAIVDVPNRRSSHGVPTPRGGGVGVVVGMLMTFSVAVAVIGSTTGALLPTVGILIVAAIGWHDDRVSASVPLRLFCHTLGALTLVPLVGMLTSGGSTAAAVIIAWIVWAVYAINIVNFMDGIDGLIATFAVMFGAHLLLLGGSTDLSGLFGAALAGASLGFLMFNWPPAKIFLGDVGSGAIGLAVVAGGALMARRGIPIVAIFLPLYPLVLDATVTLIRRALRGERLTQPHRTHLYQRLANGGWGHARVTILYALCGCTGAAVGLAHGLPGWASLAIGYGAMVAGVGWALSRRISYETVSQVEAT